MTFPRSAVIAVVLVALVVGLPVGWYLISPLFINRSVDEALPAPAFGLAPTGAEPTAKATGEPAGEMNEAMPSDDTTGMSILARGEFYAVAHEGHGRATVHQLADGSRVLRLDDFEVLNGPDLHVYLVPIDPVPNQIGSEIPGAVDLGELKGNIGSQNYDLPVGLDLGQFKSVVIWCQPFRVPFIAAPLG